MTTHYFTIANIGEGLYKEKGSKFIGFAHSANNEAEVKQWLIHYRKIYHDARHFCYAFVLGENSEHIRANDDGEPNHAAGDPILGQINSKELTNTLVIVIRYFGGTKLGVSGLINAYKTAASLALENSQVVKKEITLSIEINYTYQETNEVMRLIDELGIVVVHQKFEADCNLMGKIRIDRQSLLKDKITLLQDTGHEITLSAFTGQDSPD